VLKQPILAFLTNDAKIGTQRKRTKSLQRLETGDGKVQKQENQSLTYEDSSYVSNFQFSYHISKKVVI